MSQYLSAIAILLMVMSPPLIPATVAGARRAIVGVRAVANWLRQRPGRVPESAAATAGV